MDNFKGGVSTVLNGLTQESFWEHALRISERRLNILASNIANADTPNFKARHIDFRSALQQALATQSAGTRSSREERFAAAAQALYRLPTQAAVDGNTVDMDTERGAFADQAIRHELFIQKAMDDYKEMSSLLKI